MDLALIFKPVISQLQPMWRRYISGLCPAGMFLQGSSAYPRRTLYRLICSGLRYCTVLKC